MCRFCSDEANIIIIVCNYVNNYPFHMKIRMFLATSITHVTNGIFNVFHFILTHRQYISELFIWQVLFQVLSALQECNTVRKGRIKVRTYMYVSMLSTVYVYTRMLCMYMYIKHST